MSAEDYMPSEVAHRAVEEAAAQGATVTHFNAEQFPFPLSVLGRRKALLEVFGEDADILNMGGGNFAVVEPQKPLVQTARGVWMLAAS